MIDEDRMKLRADRRAHERSRDRAVHAAGYGTDRFAIANALANRAHGIMHERTHLPRRLASADLEQESIQDLAAARCVRHLGMKLNGEDAALFPIEGGHRTS